MDQAWVYLVRFDWTSLQLEELDRLHSEQGIPFVEASQRTLRLLHRSQAAALRRRTVGGVE